MIVSVGISGVHYFAGTMRFLAWAFAAWSFGASCVLAIAPLEEALDGFDGSGQGSPFTWPDIVTVGEFTTSSVNLLPEETQHCRRCDADDCNDMKGLVLGFFKDSDGKSKLTKAAKVFDGKVGNKLTKLLESFPPQAFKEGKNRVLWGFVDGFEAVALVCIGEEGRGIDEVEQRHAQKEAVRVAVAGATRALWEGSSKSLTSIDIDPMDEPEAASEAAHLSTWAFDFLKKSKKQRPCLHPVELSSDEQEEWDQGKVKAEAQNLARRLSETPANLMTPAIMAREAMKELEPLGVVVKAYDKDWIESEKMNAFLSVNQGSGQPPVFLEMIYNGAESEKESPYVFVGKGITFDSGGVSLKTPSSGMNDMRSDMAGGAVVIGVLKAAAELKLPVNIVGLVPLTENMIDGKSSKVMDVVIAKNGKSIEIVNTDAEGRLVLADALTYGAEKFNPKVMVDIATLTGGIVSGLGRPASAVFTRHNAEWKKLAKASAITGDRVWRMPLWDYYRSAMVEGHLADVTNSGSHERYGSPCTAAAFLREFVPSEVPWMHVDIAASNSNGFAGDPTYYVRGFTGRPLRTLVQFMMDCSD